MLELASSGYITATDLADYLVKNHFISFRKAYQKTAAIVNLAEKNKKALNDLTLEEIRKVEPKLTNDVFKVFNLNNSVKSKKSYGGTSFDNIKKMITKYKNKNDKKNYFCYIDSCLIVSCGKSPVYKESQKKLIRLLSLLIKQ